MSNDVVIFDDPASYHNCRCLVQHIEAETKWRPFCWRHIECIFFIKNICIFIQIWRNTLRPRQHGRNVADDTFKRIFFNENVMISIKI